MSASRDNFIGVRRSTHTRPTMSERNMVKIITNVLIHELISDMENALKVLRDRRNIVPYLDTKLWPVSWKKTFTPQTINVRFRFEPWNTSFHVPLSAATFIVLRKLASSSLICSSVKRPTRSRLSEASAASSRPWSKSQRGDWGVSIVRLVTSESFRGHENLTSGMCHSMQSIIEGIKNMHP